MSKSLSTQTLLDFIEQIPKEEQNVFLVDFCRAIQKRKDEIIAMNGFSPFPDSYDMNHVPSEVNPLKYLVIEKISKTLLGEDFHSILSSQSSPIHQNLDPNSTEAALQRVEEWKKKYNTPEKRAEIRNLRAEVEEMLCKIEAIDNDKNGELTDEDRQRLKQQVLQSYSISKYRGRKLDGDPINFVKRIDTYGRFIEANVIFKADLRKIDKELVGLINKDVYDKIDQDPLLPSSHYTELVASGILGDDHEMLLAQTMITKRSSHKKYQRLTHTNEKLN